MKSPCGTNPRSIFLAVLLVTLGAYIPFIHATPKQSAKYSRVVILPLVSEPGKERALFSAFQNKNGATWNKKFWGTPLGFDQFTGIGWLTAHAGVLITPEHIICASHYAAWHGIHLYGEEGQFLGEIKLAKDENGKNPYVNVKPDICVMKLDTVAPPEAKIYSLPNPDTHGLRIGWSDLPLSEKPILVATDWRNPIPKKTDDPEEKQRWQITRSAHPVTLFRISPHSRSISWRYGRHGDPKIHPSYHETINKGDSSNPIFWVTRSGLVLASTFTGVGGGPDYGHPDVQKEIQAAIDKLGGEKPYKLKTVPVP